MILFGKCGRCANTGMVKERGEQIPNDELTPAQFAERMVEGGFFYRAIESPCPDLSNSKHKRV